MTAPKNERVSTVHLGQFTRETANEIAGKLEKAGIVWWYKEPGWLSQVWEFGVRLFVDRDRLDEARAIADRVSARREARRQARERGESVPRRAEPRSAGASADADEDATSPADGST